jgi:hypothetical protein
MYRIHHMRKKQQRLRVRGKWFCAAQAAAAWRPSLLPSVMLLATMGLLSVPKGGSAKRILA